VLQTELAAEREARLRADELSARRADLLGMLSHEVRTPLHASQGYLELLELSANTELTPVQRGYIDRMRQCQAYLVAVLEGVMALARLERGASDLDLVDVGVDAILATIPPLVEPHVREKSVRYEQPAGDPSVTMRVDREKLQQIVVNLVTNAVKFTPPDGLVTVSWQASVDAVSILVTDTGAGIPPKDIERIFEPFVQGALIPSGVSHGVGLGLAISRQLAQLMGGDLTVTSAPGDGATFTLRLPRAG
jgi:two-component system, cell cycle sensor histidine kinase PleC